MTLKAISQSLTVSVALQQKIAVWLVMVRALSLQAALAYVRMWQAPCLLSTKYLVELHSIVV